MSGRMEVISRISGRRRWTVEQKLAVLRDAFGPDGCVRSACERHEVGSGAIYTWRRLAVSGELAGVRKPKPPAFAEVQISNPALLPSPTPQGHGQIGIALPTGVRLTVDASVDAEALSRVIGVLTR